MTYWDRTKFSNIAKLTKGISYTSSDYCGVGEGAVFVTLKCIAKDGGFSRHGIKYYKGLIPKEKILIANDLLFANTDLTRNGDIVGCPVYLPDLGNEFPITMSMDLSRVDFLGEEFDPEFIYYQLMTDRVRRFMRDNSSGSTVLHLNTGKVYDLDIDFPTLRAEQGRVAEILSTADEAIERTQALIDKYSRIKRGLMQDLLTRGIDENGNIRNKQTHKFTTKNGIEVPDDWDVVTLGSLSHPITSGSRGWAAYYTVQGDKFIRIGNLSREHIDFKLNNVVFVETPSGAEQLRTGLLEGDILISITADLGMIGVVPKDFGSAYINQHIARVRLNEGGNPRWVGYFLLCEHGQFQFQMLNEAGAKAGLNLPTVASLLIAVPKENEQIKAVKILDSALKLIESERRKLLKLQAIKKGLMQDLLSGRKRVRMDA